MYTELGKLLFEYAGDDYYLGNFSKITVTPTTETTNVKGFYQTVGRSQTLASVRGGTEWKISITVPILTRRLLDAFVFGVVSGEAVATQSMMSSKLVKTSADADTTITLPVGGSPVSVSIATFGREKVLTSPADYSITSNVVTIDSSGAGANESVAVIYKINASNVQKVGMGGQTINKLPDTVKIQWVSLDYNAQYPMLFIAESCTLGNPPELNMGEIGETTLELTPNAIDGTPFYYVPITSALSASLSL
jgi:hypothetical protein